MDRRKFFQQAGMVGAAATMGCSTTIPDSSADESPSREPATSPHATMQSEEGVCIHPSTSSVMDGFPPALERQVTLENCEHTQENMRWWMHHVREFFPTQRVHRGNSPVGVLPRLHRDDLLDLEYNDTTGEKVRLSQQLKSLDMDAFIVLQGGEILGEHYFHGMTPETPHGVYSVNKSIVSSVVATLLGDSLDEARPIEFYIPELLGTAYEGVTVRQCLDMESGVRYTYGVSPDDTIYLHERSIGPAARELGVPVGDYHFIPTLERHQEHGRGMIYKESDPGVLAWAAEKVTGKRFATLLSDRIWSKLGAEFDLDAVCDQLGHWTYHLAMTLRDLARWGQMCLGDGEFQGRQIVPAAFFEDIRHNASVERLAQSPMTGDFFPAGIGYRSFFYHHRESGDAIAAAGGYGQFCYANRRHNVVIAFFSTTEPWIGQAAAGVPFADIFALDQRQERERWHLCHELARLL